MWHAQMCFTISMREIELKTCMISSVYGIWKRTNHGTGEVNISADAEAIFSFIGWGY